MSTINVIQIEQVNEEAEWDRYVVKHEQATRYHLLAWRHVIHAVFNHPTYYFMAIDDHGEAIGILPLVFLKSRMFGRFLVSLPYFNYGGVLANDRKVAEALLEAAKNCGKDLQASHIELRQQHCLELDWPCKDHKVSMQLTLPQRFEDLMKSFPPKLRSQVRRGEKEGMMSKIGGIELLDDFYKVFVLNWRDLGTPVYAKRWFAEILSAFPKEVRICIVSLKGKPLAAGFVHGFRDTLEIPWAPFDRRYARMAPNMMLYGSVLKYACEQGYRMFDFGRSSKDSGTYRFKEQWGARPVQLHWYYWLQGGGDRLPDVNPQNPKYRLAIETWRRLPLAVTTCIGPRVAKYLPL